MTPKRGRPPRSEASAETLRLQVVAAAKKLFAEESYAGLTMRKIAARVGCAPGAIYLHFPNKEALLRHVWEEELNSLDAYVQGAVDQVSTPLAKLRQACLAWVRYYERHPEEFRIMFGPQKGELARASSVPESGLGRSTETYCRSRDLLADMIRGNPGAPQDFDLAMQCLLSAIFGVVAMKNSPSQFPWYDPLKLAELSIDSILMGWGVDVRPVGDAG
ncbi:MAG: TetR/AcrR family transcriptional regulator [Sphingopyxis sp.]